VNARPAVTAASPSSLSGIAYALGAFGLWGAFPLYFAALASVPAPEVLAHRIVWSVLCVAIALWLWRQWPAVGRALADRRTLLALAGSALLISANWLVFIWAVAHGRVLEASLGYYITPLVSVLLGWLVLRERLTPLQWGAVALAALGVGVMLARAGALPWVSLALAATFSAYGLVRKLTAVAAMPGLFIEVLVLAPLAVVYLSVLGGAGNFFSAGAGMSLLLAAAGLVTATPLILYAQAVRRLRLASVGLFQYITPTAQMLLAVFVFGETFKPTHAVTFGCIWVALALYSASAWRRREPAGPAVRDA
jgi:chloramphenicol-sensitive protein RarD